LPSLAEGRPNVIYEAMASECPIVATNVGGIPEQVKNGYNGFLVEPQDFETFAARISYLLDDDEFRIAMGENGRKRLIEKGWTWDNYAKKVLDIYKQVV
ncbi:MAG: glycosyltransferase family 4 protein, partial [Bacteroidales bacterium]|nr:glycosyltransferase family 4 protein [Bacteroidales bacterium]